MENLEDLQRHVDRLYAELAELKRYLITHLAVGTTADDRAWSDLSEASKDISARWSGPDVVEEIRAQREK